jgi:peptidoglycan/xylan/chitin deacetylase (PgdA/CDA1 family)
MRQAAFSLSIDDGHPLDMRMAEMLMRHEMRATFYVPLRNSEGPPVLAAPALRELAQYFEIGSHTLDHRHLNQLDVHEALRQIHDGKAALQDRLGKKVAGFCYPGGQYHALHSMMVQSAGFSYARTVKNLYLSAGESCYEMPTTLQFYPHPYAILLRNFISQRDWKLRRKAFGVVVHESGWLERLYLLINYAARSGGVCHLWCHSLDVDRLKLWKRLDELLAYAAQQFTAPQRLDNAQLLARAQFDLPA